MKRNEISEDRLNVRPSYAGTDHHGIEIEKERFE
jgi:hypothetical protein